MLEPVSVDCGRLVSKFVEQGPGSCLLFAGYVAARTQTAEPGTPAEIARLKMGTSCSLSQI